MPGPVDILKWENTGVGKSRFTVVSMGNSLLLYYYLLIIIFHANNCKSAFAQPCTISEIKNILSLEVDWKEHRTSELAGKSTAFEFTFIKR